MEEIKEKEASIEEVHAIMRRYLGDSYDITSKTSEPILNPYSSTLEFKDNTKSSLGNEVKTSFVGPERPYQVHENLYEAKKESDEALNRLINKYQGNGGNGNIYNEPYEINGSMNERANFENNAYYSQTQRSKYNRPFKIDSSSRVLQTSANRSPIKNSTVLYSSGSPTKNSTILYNYYKPDEKPLSKEVPINIYRGTKEVNTNIYDKPSSRENREIFLNQLISDKKFKESPVTRNFTFNSQLVNEFKRDELIEKEKDNRSTFSQIFEIPKAETHVNKMTDTLSSQQWEPPAVLKIDRISGSMGKILEKSSKGSKFDGLLDLKPEKTISSALKEVEKPSKINKPPDIFHSKHEVFSVLSQKNTSPLFKEEYPSSKSYNKFYDFPQESHHIDPKKSPALKTPLGLHNPPSPSIKKHHNSLVFLLVIILLWSFILYLVINRLF